MNVSAWIKAARLRTLPLTLVCIGTGNAASSFYGYFSWSIFFLTLSTAFLLQILSNFANDYGDFVKGTDNENRVGPQRTMQGGFISISQMKTALWIVGLAALFSGILLLYFSLNSIFEWTVFFVMGLFSIAAAITYTVGKKAYGYNGLGDVMVFIFFGLVGVFGSFYLQSGTLEFLVFLPAASVGLFSTGVLNMNNLRDMENDKASGKMTLAVKMGRDVGKLYQALLILSGIFCSYLFLFLNDKFLYSIGLLPPAVFFAWHLISVFREGSLPAFDKHLKISVAATLLYGICFVAIAVYHSSQV